MMHKNTYMKKPKFSFLPHLLSVIQNTVKEKQSEEYLKIHITMCLVYYPVPQYSNHVNSWAYERAEANSPGLQLSLINSHFILLLNQCLGSKDQGLNSTSGCHTIRSSAPCQSYFISKTVGSGGHTFHPLTCGGPSPFPSMISLPAPLGTAILNSMQAGARSARCESVWCCWEKSCATWLAQ